MDEPDDMNMTACHYSILAQNAPVQQELVADGKPMAAPGHWRADNIKLSRPHKYYGDCGKHIGIVHAIAEGCDPGRYLCHLDGSILQECPHCSYGSFVGKNTAYFTQNSFPSLFASVLAGRNFSDIGDSISNQDLRHRGFSVAYEGKPTLNYRCNRALEYINIGHPTLEGVRTDIKDIQFARRLGGDPL